MRHVSSAPFLSGLAILALIFGVGCTSNDGTTASASNDAARTPDRSVATSSNDAVTPRRQGTPIKVTWEALAHERHLYENSRFGQRGVTGMKPDFAIVLVNESHPEADQIQSGAVRGGEGVGSGVISNQQMKDLLEGLSRIGYFKSASSTMAQARLLQDDRARGRVTVERPAGSVTLLSMRGQGLAPTTKHIPAIYTQAKQAIAMLKNRARTLTVKTIGRDELPYR